MSTAPEVEIVIKISEVPQAKIVENNWREFIVDVFGKEVVIKVKPKVFAKIEKAPTEYPEWIAKITGKLGDKTPKGFILLEPAIAVFQNQKQVKNQDSSQDPSVELTKEV